jgi:hypothetical protein
MKGAFIGIALPTAFAFSLHSLDQPFVCQWCAVIECGGTVCGYGCVEGGTTFEGCTATVNGCSGAPCGWARVLVPFIRELATDSKRSSQIERLVESYGNSLRWSDKDPFVLEVYGCDNSPIALIRVADRSTD